MAVSVVGSTPDAVAKRGFVEWNDWDFYDRPDEPVDVRYVWDANYDGIQFPKKKTTVLKVKASGPRRSLYWRATTLDELRGRRLARGSRAGRRPSRRDDEIDVQDDRPAPPERPRTTSENWVTQEVTVEALAETRLARARRRPSAGSGRTTGSPRSRRTARSCWPSRSSRGDTLHGLELRARSRGPRQLDNAGTDYPDARPTTTCAPLPDSSASRRCRPSTRRTATPACDEFLAAEPLIGETGHADALRPRRRGDRRRRTPRTRRRVTLESWFRGEEGGFTYDEHADPSPTRRAAARHPSCATKRGYCQHFAGAMALMLRYLGIPARVAAGLHERHVRRGTSASGR